MALTKEKYVKKNFTIGIIGPEIQRPTYGVLRVGEVGRAIGHVTVTAK